MNLETKKDLASNWFKLIQNSVCNDIYNLENNKIKFTSTTWKRNEKKLTKHMKYYQMLKLEKNMINI